ncbi:hypothetical protein LTR27_009138 [Elasticomyces elasticus]|nr:hypothetical protein LTR27_009138 [Elasticomyces elasticus]
MARQQSLEEKLEACINALLQKEFPYTHTSDINEAAAFGALNTAAKIVSRKKSRKEGVRPPKFLDLPPEIRDQIYACALKYRERRLKGRPNEFTIQLDEAYGPLKRSYPKGQFHPVTQPSLTRVSRQLRTETLSMYYSINSFELRLDDASVKVKKVEQMQALKWLAAIGASNAQLIKDITIIYSYDQIPKIEMSRLMKETALSTVAAVAVVDGAWCLDRMTASMFRR